MHFECQGASTCDTTAVGSHLLEYCVERNKDSLYCVLNPCDDPSAIVQIEALSNFGQFYFRFGMKPVLMLSSLRLEPLYLIAASEPGVWNTFLPSLLGSYLGCRHGVVCRPAAHGHRDLSSLISWYLSLLRKMHENESDSSAPLPSPRDVG